MTTKQLALRRTDECCNCKVELAAGSRAMWNSANRTVTCLNCAGTGDEALQPREPAAPEEPDVDIGVAGASARAKGQALFDQELARREAVKQQHPILGRVGLAMIGPPTEGKSWLKGAVGEELFGDALESMRDEGVLPLHDRRIPRSSANIDHLAVTPNGVWVIDPKRYDGKVEVIDKGGWFRTDVRLIVNGRDRTKLVEGVHRQRAHVMKALEGTAFADAPVYGALCFVDSGWPWFAKPKIVDGVVVSWGKALRPMLTEAGDFDAEQRDLLHRYLAKALPRKA